MTRKLLFSILITGMIVGCHPGGAEYVDELDLVLTKYEESFDFESASTFALPAKIPKVTGAIIEGEEPEYLNQEQANLILNKIRENMIDRGYVETDIPTEADLIIRPATISSTTVVLYCDYWSGYWDWWYYPGYGGCYYPTGYTYTTGSLLITMQNGSPTPEVVNVWGAAINGLLEDSKASIEARVQKGIDQAFQQSPYLTTH